jgi:hypothetical protein
MASSLTAKCNGIACEIITKISVCATQIVQIGNNKSSLYSCDALWDTGATNSVITEGTASLLGIKPIDYVNVCHAGGVSKQPVYMVDIYLPNKVLVQNVRVTCCPDTTGNFGVIIGMNIITKGDFALTNVGGKSTFSFRMPSMETIDYVKHKRGMVDTPFIAPKKQGRNEQCACGSGRKYKECCGKNK